MTRTKANYLANLTALAVLLIGSIVYALPSTQGSITGMYSIEGTQMCVVSNIDNCPDDYNPDQKDSDGDGIGDVCDDEYNPSAEPQGCITEEELPEEISSEQETPSKAEYQSSIPIQGQNVQNGNAPQPTLIQLPVAQQDYLLQNQADAPGSITGSLVLITLTSFILLLVLLIGLIAIFEDKIKKAYIKTKARIKFRLKK
jgi:hypothetical protein